MNFQQTVKQGSDEKISSNDGTLIVNQTTAEIIIRDKSTYLPRVIISSNGFTYYDEDGKSRIYIGSDPRDGHIVEAISKKGIDVLNELGIER